MGIEYQLLKLGKQCLLYLEQAVYSFRINNPGDGLRKVKVLSGCLMEWYSVYEQAMLGMEELHQELRLAMGQVLNAIEARDGILIADMLELQLCPLIYQLQALLLEAGTPYVDFDIFFHNLTLLNMHMPELVDTLHLTTEGMSEAEVRVLWEQECERYVASGPLEPSSSGYATFAVKKEGHTTYMHSNGNPIWEAYLQAFQYYDVDTEKYFLFGMGLGYLPAALLDLDCSVDITVYECDMDSFRMAILTNPLDCLFLWRNVHLIFDMSLKKLSECLDFEAVNIISPAGIQMVRDDILRERLELLYMRDVNTRNLKREFVCNFRLNCKNCNRYVDELHREFEGKNVVIIAAGPSLNKNIHLLKKLPSDTIIMAVGTVFKLLMGMGITPDYVIFMEAGAPVYLQVEGLLESKVPIIIGSTAYWRIAMDYQGPKYMVCQQGYKKAAAYAEKNGWGVYAGGGNVSTIALSVCVQLGCREVAFIGLDLSYSDERTHANGTRQDERVELSELKPMPGINKDVVYVSREFLLCCEWIEKYAADLSHTQCRRIIDATEGGVYMKNMEIMTFEEVLKEWGKNGRRE